MGDDEKPRLSFNDFLGDVYGGEDWVDLEAYRKRYAEYLKTGKKDPEDG